MAAEMSAILRLKAAVSGLTVLEGMAKGLGNIEKQGQKTTKAMEGMAASAGGLAGGFRSLIPLLSGGGLVMLAQRSIEAGDKLWDMSQRTGVSVEMLSRFSKAAKLSGTDIDSVAGALVKLSRTMASASSGANTLATTQAEAMRRQLDEVRRGERQQTQLLQEQADARLEVLNRETDARLRVLARRYRNEAQLASDRFDDQQSATERGIQQREDAELKALDRRFEAERRAIQRNQSLGDDARQQALDGLRDQQDQATEQIRQGYQRQLREVQRGYRDQRQVQQDALDDRRQAEEAAIKGGADRRQAAIRAESAGLIQAVRDRTASIIEAMRGQNAALDEDGLNTGKASEAFRQLGIAVRDSSGRLRDSSAVMIDVANKFKLMQDGPEKAALAMQMFGRGGAQLIPLLNMGGAEIMKFKGMTTEFAKSADEASDKLTTLEMKIGGLGGKLAKAMLPMLGRVTDALAGMIEAFNRLDPGMQAAIGYGAAFAIAWGPISGILINTIKLFLALAPVVAGIGPALAAIPATIAGWLGIVGPVMAAITPFFTGLVAVLTGPIGIIAGLIAVGLAVYTFRDQITGALTQLGEFWFNVFDSAFSLCETVFTNIIESFTKTVTNPFGVLLKALRGDWLGALKDLAAQAFKAFGGIGESIGKQLSSAFNSATNAVLGI